jgi:hypothetical protein
MTDGPHLLKVDEHGEIKSGTITGKDLAAYQIDSYGRIFGLTFQAGVNDDLDVFSDLSGMMIRGARTWFSALLIDIILAHPKLLDNQPLFSAAHKNLSPTPAAPSEASLAEGRTAMRLQTDASGNPINATPRYILAPAAFGDHNRCAARDSLSAGACRCCDGCARPHTLDRAKARYQGLDEALVLVCRPICCACA